MSTHVCPSCGLESTAPICPYHLSAMWEGWATANRIWCDLLHRGVPIKRLYPTPLTHDDWADYSYPNTGES